MLTLNTPNKRGAQVNEAIKEIIFNLEKYDKNNVTARNNREYNKTTVNLNIGNDISHFQRSKFGHGRNEDRKKVLTDTSYSNPINVGG